MKNTLTTIFIVLLFLAESQNKTFCNKSFYLIKYVKGGTKEDIVIKECLLTHKRLRQVLESTK